MKLFFVALSIFFIVLSSSAQDKNLTTWAVMKDLIGMETTAAEKLIKSHGYKYDRSFEGLGIKFKEYSPEKRDYLLVNTGDSRQKHFRYDNIISGERKGKIDFIKFEFADQEFKKFESALLADKFEQLYDTEDVSDLGVKACNFSHPNKDIKIRLEANTEPTFRASFLFLYKSDIPLCFPSYRDLDWYGMLITKRNTKEDEDGIKSYLYNDALLKMSCSQNDTGIIVAEKVRLLWNLYRDKFNNSIDGFNLQSSNIMFYAVRMIFEDFLYDMFKTYHLDINLKYLPMDMTILDFSRFEIESTKKEIPVRQSKLSSHQNLYKLLRKLGAKHSEEL